MPTYQYACTACGEQLEAVQSFSDPSLTDCPVCGGTLRKVFSAVGVVFKGSGFYKTDSRKSSSASDPSKSSEKSSDKPAEKKADAPAAKSESSKSSSSSSGPSSSASSSPAA